ncbi:UbiD family decarboxylase [Azospirillum sp. ST 5-10]|uniref:UbiD family decarboxylase n=1 Tax=unclassified Azospirillum TaxID=2630922 RepID=UPI003F4A5098
MPSSAHAVEGAQEPQAGRAATLRDWLDHLAARDRLAVARPGVGLRFELAAIAKRLDGRKAALFPSPDGHAMPVVAGIVADRGWIAEAMGVPRGGLLARYRDAARNPLPWHEVARAPVQEVVRRDGIDLGSLLPLPTHNELDSGPYITAGLIITRNPRTGVQNVAINRCQLSGPDRLGILILPRHTHYFYDLAEEAGDPLEVAIVIGADPLTLLASQAIVPVDHDELEIAGALHGRPLPVARCVTNELRVPADAEIVIEGRILSKAREPEGPFGEFPQYYGERANRHVIAVDAVTHRRDAIFHTILGGAMEHLLLGGIPREATLLDHLQRGFPGVRDVHLSKGGVCRYHLYVQMRKRHDGEAKNVILGALAGHYDVKHVVVVDEDVDIHDPDEVEWAVATRSQADRDLIVIANAQGSKLDPSTREGVGTKTGIDATVPLDAGDFKFKRIHVPGEEAVELDRVIDAAAAADWRRAVGL